MWKFTGEQEDGAAGDTAYYFLRARYLDVGTGRFVSKDPVEFDQRYAYAGGNPVLYADPSGQCIGKWWKTCANAFRSMLRGARDYAAEHPAAIAEAEGGTTPVEGLGGVARGAGQAV